MRAHHCQQICVPHVTNNTEHKRQPQRRRRKQMRQQQIDLIEPNGKCNKNLENATRILNMQQES